MSGILAKRETIEGEDKVMVAPQMARMPVKSKRITLGNGYEMFWVDVRLNAPRSVFRDFGSGDNDRYIASITQIVAAWNVADDQGNPLPCDVASLDSLPNDLIGEISSGFIAAFNEEVTVPKERSAPSATGSTTIESQ